MAREGFYFKQTRVYTGRGSLTIERDGQSLDMPVGEAPLLIEALVRQINAPMGGGGQVHSTEESEEGGGDGA